MDLLTDERESGSSSALLHEASPLQSNYQYAYGRTNHSNLHTRGCKEKGNINTPMELAINDQADRFSFAIDTIERIAKAQRIRAHAEEEFRDRQIASRRHAYEHGIDSPAISG